MQNIQKYFAIDLIASVCLSFSLVALAWAATQTSLLLSIHPATVQVGMVDDSGQIIESVIVPTKKVKRTITRKKPKIVKNSRGIESIVMVTEQVSGEFITGELPQIKISNATDAAMMSVEMAMLDYSIKAATAAAPTEAAPLVSIDLSQTTLSTVNNTPLSSSVLSDGGTFVKGTTESITLFNSTESFTEFDLTGVQFFQDVNGGTKAAKNQTMYFVITII